GGTGLVGTALTNVLRSGGFSNVLPICSSDCDLLDWQATRAFFLERRPDFVFHLSGRVYGMMGNIRNKGISFLDNTLINRHTVEESRLAGVRKIVGMGFGCVYTYPSPG